jgi:hypothetical protein
VSGDDERRFDVDVSRVVVSTCLFVVVFVYCSTTVDAWVVACVCRFRTTTIHRVNVYGSEARLLAVQADNLIVT